MAFAIGGKLGVDLAKTYTDGVAPFQLGDEVTDSAGTTFKFVRFSAAKTTAVPYLIGSDFTLGNEATTAGVSVAPVGLGVPQVDLTAPDSGVSYSYGWVAIKGPMSVFVAGATSANVEILTTSVSGMLASAGTGKRVDGLRVITAPGSIAVSALASAYSADTIQVPTDA